MFRVSELPIESPHLMELCASMRNYSIFLFRLNEKVKLSGFGVVVPAADATPFLLTVHPPHVTKSRLKATVHNTSFMREMDAKTEARGASHETLQLALSTWGCRRNTPETNDVVHTALLHVTKRIREAMPSTPVVPTTWCRWGSSHGTPGFTMKNCDHFAPVDDVVPGVDSLPTCRMHVSAVCQECDMSLSPAELRVGPTRRWKDRTCAVCSDSDPLMPALANAHFYVRKSTGRPVFIDDVRWDERQNCHMYITVYGTGILVSDLHPFAVHVSHHDTTWGAEIHAEMAARGLVYMDDRMAEDLMVMFPTVF